MESTIHHRVRRLRRRRGLSQRHLAEAVGRDRSWVAHLERGALSPDREQARLLAAALGVSSRTLWGGMDRAPAPALRTPAAQAVARFDLAAPRRVFPCSCLPPRTERTRALLDRLPLGAPRLRATLGAMELSGEDAWVLALGLAVRGAGPGRLSPARLGFPWPLVLRDGRSAAHQRRPCLVWNGPRETLVLFGATRVGGGGRQGILPLVLAGSGVRNVYLAFHPDRSGRFRDGVEWVSLRDMTGPRAEEIFRRTLTGCAAPPGS